MIKYQIAFFYLVIQNIIDTRVEIKNIEPWLLDAWENIKHVPDCEIGTSLVYQENNYEIVLCMESKTCHSEIVPIISLKLIDLKCERAICNIECRTNEELTLQLFEQNFCASNNQACTSNPEIIRKAYYISENRTLLYEIGSLLFGLSTSPAVPTNIVKKVDSIIQAFIPGPPQDSGFFCYTINYEHGKLF